MKVIFNLLFYSGIREGEMLALTLNDFNFENNTLSINKSYAVVDKKEIIKEQKNCCYIITNYESCKRIFANNLWLQAE